MLSCLVSVAVVRRSITTYFDESDRVGGRRKLSGRLLSYSAAAATTPAVVERQRPLVLSKRPGKRRGGRTLSQARRLKQGGEGSRTGANFTTFYKHVQVAV